MCTACSDEENANVQTTRIAQRATSSDALPEKSPVLGVVGNGGGRPLAADVRADMEGRLGADFSDVRIHTDSDAAASAASVQAAAYTVGHEIVFGDGSFDPVSTGGRHTLAHELTHVLQQRSGPVSGTDHGSGVAISDPSDAFERAAEATADRVTAAPTPIDPKAGAPPPSPAGQGVAGLRPSSVPIHHHKGAATPTFGTVQRQDSGAGGAPPFSTGGGGGTSTAAPPQTTARETSRAVNDDERKNAATVFGDSLNLDGITIEESAVMSFGAGFGPFARTLPKTVYVWPGELDSPSHIRLMMHEFTHLWQYQHGIGVPTTLYNAVKGNYDFGGAEGLRKAWASCKHFVDFNTEQQGDICQWYWTHKQHKEDTSAYEPYIAEVKNGGTRGKCDPGKK